MPLIVCNALSARIGGGQTYVTNLLARLPADPELRVHLFAQGDLEIARDPRIVRVETKWPVRNPIRRTIWERLALPGYLRQVRADVLFCPGGVVATRAPRECRTATMFRNMMPFDPAAYGRFPWGLARLRTAILRRVMLRSMRRADLTIFISEFARRFIEQLADIPHAVTIPHGISRAFRTADDTVARPRAAGDEPYLLYVSRFEPYKHHREVVEAYALLPEALQQRFRLLLVGTTDFAEADIVRAMITRMGLTRNVLMLGGVPYRDLPAFYRHAAAILFASSCENCPNILLESLASGQPVLSSDVMPMPEFGGGGIEYFSPYEPEEIRDGLVRVLTDPEHAARVAAAGLAQAGNYDWDWTARTTWSELLRLAQTSDWKVVT